MKSTFKARIAGISLLLIVASAHAGPPFLTNDTDVTDYKQAEFYLYSDSQTNSFFTNFDAPALEVDWGFAPNWEASIVVPYDIWIPSDGTQHASGIGDTSLSLEYRFWQETADSPAIAFAPQISFPSGNANQNLGYGVYQTQLPIWLQKSFGSWTIDTGGGYNIMPTKDLYNNFFGGFLLQKQISNKLILGGEIFYQGAISVEQQSYTVLNLGGSYNFTPQLSLLFSLGNSIAGQQNLISYIGLTWTT